MTLRAPNFPPSAPTGATAAVDPTIVRSIRQASSATDIDFGYLMAQARSESGLHADAAAPNSSARGLYQFIDSTWLDMVRRFGDRYGVGDLARQIGVSAGGRPVVANARLRRQILRLRDDPGLSASLAAEYARCNKAALEQALGRPATSTDLYLAHFLGAGGATDLLQAMQHHPGAAAAGLLPEAAAANRSVFYNRRSGAARSVTQIYKTFATRIEKQSTAFADVMQANAAAPPAPIMAAATPKMMPLARAPRMMPLRIQRAAMPLVAMLNNMAVTAMQTLSRRPVQPRTQMRMIAVAPAAAAAPPRKRANQLA